MKDFIKYFTGLKRNFGFCNINNGYKDPDTGKLKFNPGDYGWSGKLITEEDYTQHLNGTKSIGIQPCDDDGLARFGAIDIDPKVYKNLDIKFYLDTIQQKQLPLIPIKSKSGGLHLYIFTKELVKAKVIKDFLEQVLFLFKLPITTEIFPKQTRLGTNTDDQKVNGNFINLPYFNKNERVALDPSGQEMTLDLFLEVVAMNLMTSTKLKEISDNLIKTEALNLGKPTANDLFVSRSPTTSKGFTEGKAYNAHSAPYVFGQEDVKQSVTELTDIQKQTLETTQQTQLNEAQIKLYESETARDEARKKRIIASQETMVEDIKKKDAEKKVRAELKEKSKLLNAPASPDDLSDGLKSKLAKFGIMLGKKIPIVAAGLAYKEAEAKGMSPVESVLYGASELTPVPAGDVEAAGAFVKQAREEGLPQALGLDVERQEQMNKLRQERMAARSRTNMPDLDDIPDTEDPDTLPPEALRVMQQDADMTNTDLDPEAGFISEADIMRNQQMGSPTSQGFMSRYGEEDQNLLQTT